MRYTVFEATVHCPWCARYTVVSQPQLHVHLVNGTHEGVNKVTQQGSIFYSGPTGRWWLGRCNSCKYPMLVDREGQQVLPAPQPPPVASQLPDAIRADIVEAQRCLAIGALSACVVMARRALQRACVTLGATPGHELARQIDHLQKSALITAPQKQLADAARWIGNHGAHGADRSDPENLLGIVDVTKDDAEAALEIVLELLRTLILAPALAAEQLRKRGKTT